MVAKRSLPFPSDHSPCKYSIRRYLYIEQNSRVSNAALRGGEEEEEEEEEEDDDDDDDQILN